MKRLLHALAALWPQRKEVVSPPPHPASSGLRQHLAAVLRMEGILGECADLRICKSANETLGAGALNTVRDQSAESSARQLPESPDTRLVDSPDTRLVDSPDTRLTESPDTRLVDSPNQQIADSPNQPQSLPRIPQPMPLLTILMLVFFMCLMAAPSRVFGSAVFLDSIPDSAIRPLKIGDTIPEELWHLPLQVVNHPEGKETITLNDYRGKLIILDFWASWCSACIRSINHLDSLWKTGFVNDYAVLPVTAQNVHQIERFINPPRWVLASVINDTLLSKYFPHKGIPHQVWIIDGHVIGTPRHVYATRENILAAIAREDVQAVHQTDNAILNPDLPLFEGDNGQSDAFAIGKYGVFFPYVDGFQPTKTSFRMGNNHSVLYFINIGMDLMLREAYREQIFPPFRDAYDKGVEWELKPEMEEIAYQPASENYDNNLELDQARRRWKQRYTFGYRQYAAANTSRQEMMDRLKHDIQTALAPTLGVKISSAESGKEIYLELRCLGTSRESKELLLRDATEQDRKIEITDTSRHYWGYLFGSQFHALVLMAAQKIPNLGITTARLLDSTGIDPQLPVNFWFPNAMVGNWRRIQKELERYGMELVLRRGPIPVIRVEANQDNFEYMREEDGNGQF